jgi:putative addiction module component (TIGR02574 family)
MSGDVQRLESEALKLSREERATLADKLWLSLEDQKLLDSDWAREIEKRLREIDAGTVSVIAHEDVIAEMRARYCK